MRTKFFTLGIVLLPIIFAACPLTKDELQDEDYCLANPTDLRCVPYMGGQSGSGKGGCNGKAGASGTGGKATGGALGTGGKATGGASGSGGSTTHFDASPPSLDAGPGCFQNNFTITADNGCASPSYVTTSPSVLNDGMVVKSASSDLIYTVVDIGLVCVPTTPQVALEWKDSCKSDSCLPANPPSPNGCVGVVQVADLTTYCIVANNVQLQPRQGTTVLLHTDPGTGVTTKYMYYGCDPTEHLLILRPLAGDTPAAVNAVESAIFPGAGTTREQVIPDAIFNTEYTVDTNPADAITASFSAAGQCDRYSTDLQTAAVNCIVPHVPIPH